MRTMLCYHLRMDKRSSLEFLRSLKVLHRVPCKMARPQLSILAIGGQRQRVGFVHVASICSVHVQVHACARFSGQNYMPCAKKSYRYFATMSYPFLLPCSFAFFGWLGLFDDHLPLLCNIFERAYAPLSGQGGPSLTGRRSLETAMKFPPSPR
jgi:hypothetical protein